MARKYGATARSSAFQWFIHRITGTFLVFLLVTHFWVQHYDRTTASIAHTVVTEETPVPVYTPEAAEAVRQFKAREAQVSPEEPRVIQAQDGEEPATSTAPNPSSYDVLMLRLADPVYAGLWKAFNLLFLAFALHHGFYGLNNVITDYVRNDMARVGLSALSWTVALVLFVIGAYSVIVAGL
ncbi:MAG: succinate dehydrogenase [Bacteroidota bacterium]